MTKTQMIQAVRGYDEMMDLVAEMIEAAAAGTDAMLNLIEQITQAARETAIEDIKIDLADFGQTEAVEIIRENYL
jgi:methyl-accepting chemotaxis protein